VYGELYILFLDYSKWHSLIADAMDAPSFPFGAQFTWLTTQAIALGHSFSLKAPAMADSIPECA